MILLVNYVSLQAVTVDPQLAIYFGTGKTGDSKSMDHFSKLFEGNSLCSKGDPDMFFPDDYEDRKTVFGVKEICNSCPLTDLCLTYALKHPSLDGIWGATTPRERQSLRRKRARVSR